MFSYLMHLKVTQPFVCFWLNKVYMFLSQSNIFINSPRWIFISFPVGFVISPVENLLLGLTPEKFWKFGIFPGESSSHHRGTETGCTAVVTQAIRSTCQTIAYWFIDSSMEKTMKGMAETKNCLLIDCFLFR